MTTYTLDTKTQPMVARFYSAMGLPQGEFVFTEDCTADTAHAFAQEAVRAIERVNSTRVYVASFLYQSGAIVAGHKFRAIDDARAIEESLRLADERHASVFGLHERTGTASDGRPLIRPVLAI